MKSVNKSEYTVTYSSMRGVDFSSPTSQGGRKRFSYLENMYRDYDGEGAEITESVPGFRKILSLGARINGFYHQRVSEGEEYVIVHAGTGLYRFNVNDRDSLTELKSLRTVRDSKSCGFAFGKCVYILDGGKIARIDETGTVSFISDGSAAHGYIPTTYVNCEEYEQLNLLTRRFREEYFVSVPEQIYDSSDGLRYRIIDKERAKCAVIGIDDGFTGNLYIPSYTVIGTEKYEIYKIDELAFANNSMISSVNIAEGVEEIGAKAFSNCKMLLKATLPDSLRVIGAEAFENCEFLTAVRFGKDLESIGENAFLSCPKIALVQYAYDEARFSHIDNKGAISTQYTFSPNSKNDTLRVKIPVMTPTETLTEVLVGGESVTFNDVIKDELTVAVIIPEIKREKLEGVTIEINGYAHKTKFSFNSPGVNFMSTMNGEEPSEAITKCTVCECFDGRVFLSGNPNYPTAVFYSARDKSGNNDPLYFGVMNYFNDGVGGYPIISMLSAADSLAVFKSGDDGGGSIFYHTPKSTDINILPRIYPVSYIHNGIFAAGASISFFDDPIFISSAGVLALDKKAINLERSIVCRSHNINQKLLATEYSTASFAEWCGYLAVCVNGEIFLADSRSLFVHETAGTEYDWYYLNKVGTYSLDQNVFRYASEAPDGFDVNSAKIDEEVSATVFGGMADTEIIYYTSEGAHKYCVRRTEEKKGGIFSPATILLGINNTLLFFGTPTGDVCVFNNDKRGVAPDRIKNSLGFSESAYRETMGNRIHPDFYSFAGHAPRYALSTVLDDGDIPYLTKNTVKGSLTLKCRSFGRSEIICEVGTNGKGYRETARIPDGSLDFSDLDFKRLAFFGENRFTVPISEKEKGWIEKNVSVYSESYLSPFGIYSISYRFTLKGRIKKTNV